MSDIDARKALAGVVVVLLGLLGWVGVERGEDMKKLEDRIIVLEQEVATLKSQQEDSRKFRYRIVDMMIRNKERALVP